MKATLEVSLYSGMAQHNPKADLPEDTVNFLLAKISKLDTLHDSPKTFCGMMGEDAYMVIFNPIPVENIFQTCFDIDNAPEFPLMYINNDYVCLYRRLTMEVIYYKDTQNIHSLLSDWAIPAIQEHHIKAYKEIEAFYLDPRYDYEK